MCNVHQYHPIYYTWYIALRDTQLNHKSFFIKCFFFYYLFFITKILYLFCIYAKDVFRTLTNMKYFTKIANELSCLLFSQKSSIIVADRVLNTLLCYFTFSKHYIQRGIWDPIKHPTKWKVSVYGVFLVRSQSECGKKRTWKTSNMDTFQAVSMKEALLNHWHLSMN